MSSTILERIVDMRRAAIRSSGHAQGIALDRGRTTPLVPFGRDPFLICEIKRGSPSKGAIAAGADAVEIASRYAERGVRTVSVLTEESHFAGSLADLVGVKRAFPGLCVLRKDFLLDERDLAVSFRAGADAVLLIAAILDRDTLGRLYRTAKAMGMEALVEVHGEEDIEKARSIRPSYTGFNSRDLATFDVDPVAPVRLRSRVDWPTSAVFESGIGCGEDAAFALSSGFSGLLVGEAVMRNPALVDELAGSRPGGDFWLRLYARRREGRPLVKVCGITNERDAKAAAGAGADLLGFVFAPSPRRADSRVLAGIRDLEPLKVGVVALDGGTEDLGPGGCLLASNLLQDGLLDAVQFHGEERPDDCFRSAFPYYKAVRIGSERDVENADGYRCPRVLADARVPGVPGGTGRTVSDPLIRLMAERRPLWLAGGLGPENVRDTIARHSPELIDASSLLEASPGRKDMSKLKRFFEEVARAHDLP